MPGASELPDISISIVSHGQFGLVADLLQDIADYCAGTSLEVILTLNLPESLPQKLSTLSFPVKVVRNEVRKGFGANHNAAFRESKGRFFCVLNPDIRLRSNLFPALLAQLSEPGVGVVAPQILDGYGRCEDNARAFPSPGEIIGKALGWKSVMHGKSAECVAQPDWLAGMFLMFTRDTYAAVGGFDERYFLYYEDVDICARLRLAGYRICICPAVSAIHEARRSSHRDLKYLYWHLASMLRFFLSGVYRRAKRRKYG